MSEILRKLRKMLPDYLSNELNVKTSVFIGYMIIEKKKNASFLF